MQPLVRPNGAVYESGGAWWEGAGIVCSVEDELDAIHEHGCDQSMTAAMSKPDACLNMPLHLMYRDFPPSLVPLVHTIK